MLIYSATDLKSRRVEVLEAALRGRAIVRAVDGTALVMTRLDSLERAQTVARWSILLHRLQSNASHAELAWFRHLDADEQQECLHELWECLDAVLGETMEPEDMVEVIAGWRAAAVSLADPVRREVLLGDLGIDDFEEVGRPD